MSSRPSPEVAPVVKTVTVECTREEAFRYFTADFNKWWPLAEYSCTAFSSGHKEKPASCTFPLHQGGRIVERNESGEEHVWGTVLIWEPPSRVVFSWHVMRDEQSAQTVEVRFSTARKGTEIVLIHSDWNRLGEAAQQERDRYNQGWERVFVAAYADYVNAQNRRLGA
jgi:uncharacterized protein YndB with AHSA1/START domain